MISNKVNITNITKLLKGARVLMRVDYNCPLDRWKNVTDAGRIEATIPTIKKILNCKPKSLVLMSHLGRPGGRRKKKFSLKPCEAVLSKLINKPVTFMDDCIGEEVQEKCANPKDGEIIMLENVRFHPEETGSGCAKKDNIFRKQLSQLGDIFVNDAFGTSHRAHSSMVGIKTKVKAAGLLLKKELDYFSKVLDKPERPVLVILGGAKVHDKIQLIDKMLDIVDEMIIGGGMATTFLKEIYNIGIGDSMYDEEGAKLVPEIVAKAYKNKVRLDLPIDFVCSNWFDEFAKVKNFTL